MKRAGARRSAWRRIRRALTGGRRRRGSKRFLGISLVGVFLLVLAAWGYSDLSGARRDLTAAEAQLLEAAAQLGNGTGDEDANGRAREAAGAAVGQTRRAASAIKGSIPLRLAGLIPGVTGQRSALVDSAKTSVEVAEIAQRLVGAASAADLRVNDGAVDVDALRALHAAADDAVHDLKQLPDVNRASQWSVIGNRTAKLDAAVDDVVERLEHASGMLAVATDLLGGNGSRRILVALLNNAEMRDQGMVLSFATVDTTNGVLAFGRSGSIHDLRLSAPVSDVALSAGTQQIFGALRPTLSWHSVNATVDTQVAGALMRSMYKAETGASVDAVIALDVLAIKGLLGVTGPVTVGDGTTVSAENVARLLLNDQYAELNRDKRVDQLSLVVGAVIDRIRSGSVNGSDLARAFGASASGRHAWISVADPTYQSHLDDAHLGGGVPKGTHKRTFHVAVQNGTANKLDYFVKPKVDVDIDVNADGSAVVTTNVAVTNETPTNFTPSEQFGPDNIVTTVGGLYRARVYLWSPTAAEQVDSVEESAMRLSFGVADVLPGETKQLTFRTVIPNAVRNGVLRLDFFPQPRAEPMPLRIRLREGDAASRTKTYIWDKTHELSWAVG